MGADVDEVLVLWVVRYVVAVGAGIANLGVEVGIITNLSDGKLFIVLIELVFLVADVGAVLTNVPVSSSVCGVAFRLDWNSVYSNG